ncbi:MAG: hypothetical protein IJU51_07805 [Clostridia bacterium]|nr:hypothetical protein [Clostridia bacterium]
MKKTRLSFLAVFMVMAVFVAALSGCNMELHNRNDQYVSDVKKLVNESVNFTRKLRQQDESFDCKDSEKLRGYLLAADDLINTLEKIQKLRPSDEFDEYDNQLKEDSRSALTLISQIKAMVVYAGENGDDSMYKRERDGYFADYYEHYDNMKNISSEIQTYWRNA